MRMTSQLYFIFVSAVLITELSTTVLGEREISLDDGNYVFWWEVVHPFIVIKLTVKTRGWVSLGFNAQPHLVGADLGIGGINDTDNVLYHDDYHGHANEDSILDTDTIDHWSPQPSESFQDEEKTVITYLKRLKTDDANNDEDWELKNEEIYLLWAYGTTDYSDGAYHEGAKGFIAINLFQEDEETTTPGPGEDTTTVPDQPEYGPPLSFDNGNYVIRWDVIEPRIHFKITVKNLGWVGLGVGPNENMEGADMFIGGVNYLEGGNYFDDYHATTANWPPTRDDQNDWQLNDAHQEVIGDGLTVLSISRLLATSDVSGEDFAIQDEDLYLHWSYAAVDMDFTVLPTSSGSKLVNLFDENSGGDFECPADSGNFADPLDCSAYYSCDNGIVVGHLFCPDGLYFNPVLDNCDYPWNVDCPIK